MSLYRFVGHTATKEGVFELKHFGQSIEIEDDKARTEILEGVALLTPAEFDAIGFTPAELKEFRSPDSHLDNIDPLFLQKKCKAWQAVHAAREQIREQIKEASDAKSE